MSLTRSSSAEVDGVFVETKRWTKGKLSGKSSTCAFLHISGNVHRKARAAVASPTGEERARAVEALGS